ncbi:MAG: cell division protein FtsN, partial [Enterobacteriaceae bacterium]
GLYFIAHNSPNKTPVLQGTHPDNNGIPPKPEERWSYIKELENRQVGTAGRPAETETGNKGINKQNLSEEQRQLLEQMQADMRQPPMELAEVPYTGVKPTENNTAATTQTVPVPPPATESHQQKQKTESVAGQHTNTNTASTTTVPPVAKTEKKQHERWTLQCGAFSNHDQAEQIRVQLAFSGVESRIAKSGGWYRVTLGPYSSREAANKSLQQVKKAGVSGCITLGLGT